MADAYTSHFGVNNIPYGIASSTKRPQPQAATRIGDDVIFLAELAITTTDGADLRGLFLQPTLNAFAAQPSELQAEVRTKIQEAYNAGKYTSCSEPLSAVTLHLPVSIGDFTDYSASANHVLNAGEAIQGVRNFPPGLPQVPRRLRRAQLKHQHQRHRHHAPTRPIRRLLHPCQGHHLRRLARPRLRARSGRYNRPARRVWLYPTCSGCG